MPPRRRTSDAIRAIDGLVQSHLQQSPVDPRTLVNLALTMAVEYAGAARGVLLLDEGDGLVPSFALGPGLSATEPSRAEVDRDLVEEARSSRRAAAHDDRIAAPVLMQGRAAGVVYLESSKGLSADAEVLAQTVAGRIATLLHSAALVEDASHRSRDVETLEALGGFLSAGALSEGDLQRAAEAALNATRSKQVILGLLDDAGELLDLIVLGDDPAAGSVIGEAVAPLLARGEAIDALVGAPNLNEALRGDIAPHAARSLSAPLGFAVVRRPGGAAYTSAEGSFFRALTHLLAGAIARLRYFRRASEDSLTGTGSRLALDLAFEQALGEARKRDTELAVMLIDVDDFKGINDHHGHVAGDAVLRGVAAIIRERLRSRDFVGRYGGDEFLVLLPETDHRAALQVAEALRERVAAQTFDGDARTSLSIGISVRPGDGDAVVELVRTADGALYEAKRAGRNCVRAAVQNP